MKPAFSIALALCFGACSAPRKQPEAPQYFKVDPATAGTVTGRAVFHGKRPAAAKINIEEDEECVRLNKGGMNDESILVNKDGSLANVFVYVKQGLEGKTFERPAESVVLDQKNCRFSPRVFGIRAGQTLKVTNSDPVTHNVHPIAKMNREWNQSQSPGDPALERRFARPEIMIRVKCNVHSWMRSWVAAMDHPYFAVTSSDGSFEIRNLPPGEYVLEAWQEKLGTAEQRITIAPSGKADAVFTFNGE